MILIRLSILFSALFLCALPAYAQWYESTGQASVVNQGIEQARAQAIESALRQSLDFAGGRVSSVEHVVDGVLTGHFIEWSTDGAIENAQLVRERRRGDNLEVTVRTHIRQIYDQCPAANFRKGVAVVPFEFARPEQARHGELWQLERSASEQFSRLLGQSSNSFFLAHTLERKIGLADLRGADNNQAMAGFARRVNKETDAQYIIGAVFDDISTEDVPGVNYTFWRPAKQQRNLALTLYAFDGSSGELLTRARVSGQSSWQFAYNEIVDPYSQQFWRSTYGTLLNQRLTDLVNGLDDTLGCEEPHGQVVAVNGPAITVNLGDNHGVRSGQRLYVYHRGNFSDAQGIYREQWVLSPYQLEISRVERSSSTAHAADNAMGTNIQVNDRVVIR